MKLLFDILTSIVSGTQKLNLKKLPTQGYFYPKDFDIKIRKAKVEDIIEYEFNYKGDNVLQIIDIIKNFVRKNCEFSKNYKFDDLKSIDIIFIFLEIVNFTNRKPVRISYVDVGTKNTIHLDFDYKLFNYFDFSLYENTYSNDLLSFEIDGYWFSMPSIGVENSVTNFLMRKINDNNVSFYNEQSYDFLFFLANKNNLTDSEIENLIIIFNEDLDDDERLKIKSIIGRFQNLIGYSLRVDDKIIDLKSNLDLANIWKS